MTDTLLLCNHRRDNKKASGDLQNKTEVGNMKTKFKHRVIAMTLAMMMTASPVWGAAHADDGAVENQPEKAVAESYVDNDKSEDHSNKAEDYSEPAKADNGSAESESKAEESVQENTADETAVNEPEKPVAESYLDNDKIEEYNRKVDEYNKSAEEYNKSVDMEYEEASRAVEEKNAKIDQHNAAENERVKAAEERNAQAILDAAAANDEIDRENEAEKARVEEHNKAEDEMAKTSAEAKAAAEEENEAIRVYNEELAKAVEQYAEDLAKYEADKKQYEYDVKIEQQILGLGYASVQAYNDRVNKVYNEPAAKAKKMNASTEINSVSDTYKVTEAEEKSGVDVKVRVKHVFQETDLSYTDEFTIDANDTIMLNPIAAIGSPTQPGYASFYYKTDDSHSTGYWVEAYSELQTTANYNEYGWNCGDSHEVSYREGKRHAGDEEVIEMTYYYMWMSLRTAKTYNVPVEPTKPEEPGAAKEMVEVPELYTPVYKEFVEKQHVEAQIEKIEEPSILERIANPVKRAYIALLSYMDLFDVPAEEPAEEAAPAEEIIEDVTPAEETPVVEEVEEAAPAEETPAAEEVEEAAPAEETPAVEEAEEATPAPAAEIAEEAAVVEEIAEEIVPAAPAEDAKIEEITPAAAPAAEIVEEAAPAEETPVVEEAAPAPAAEIAEEAAPAAPAEDVQTAEVIPAAVTPEKVKKAEPAPAKGTEAAATAEEVQIAEAATAETAPAAMIADKEVPMAGVEETPYWALLNLIMTILTGIISAVLLVGYFGKKEDDEENDEESDDEKTNRKGFVRLMSLIPAVGAVIAFVLTENMNNPMIFTDRWTILMAAILLIQAVVAIFAKKSEDENEDDEIAEPVNA